MMSLKIKKSEIRKPLNLFVFFFALACERIVIKNAIALKADVLQDRNICCLQARPRIIQPGNCTRWGSEGVNSTTANQDIDSKRPKLR